VEEAQGSAHRPKYLGSPSPALLRGDHESRCKESFQQSRESDQAIGKSLDRSKADLYVLCGVVFIVALGFGLFIPVMPFYATELGASPTQLGLLASAYALAQLVVTPLAGVLLDKWGRKPVIVGSLLGFAVASAVYGWAPTVSILFVGRLLEGVFSAGINPAAQAYVADVAPPSQRGRAMGILMLAVNGGFMLGPGVGGYLSHLGGYRFPFYASAVAALLSALAGLLFIRETRPKVLLRKTVSMVSPFSPSRFFHIWRWAGGALGVLFGLRFVLMFSYALLEPVMALYTGYRLGWDERMIGALFTATGLATMITPLISGQLADTRGRKPVLILGGSLGIVFTLALALTGWVRAMWGLAVASAFTFAAMLCRSIAASFRGPAVNALVTDLVPEKERGEVLGLMIASASIGQLIGPIVGSWLFEKWFMESPFLLCGALLILFTVLTLTKIRETLPPRLRKQRNIN